MQADIRKTCLRSRPQPEAIEPHVRRQPDFHREDRSGRPRQTVQDIPRRLAEPDRPRPGIAVRQIELAFAVEAPFEGQDLRLAAPGQDKQPDRCRVQRAIFFMVLQDLGEPAVFLGRQEALGPSLPVAPDALGKV